MPIPGRLGLCFGPLLPSILSPLFPRAGQKKNRAWRRVKTPLPGFLSLSGETMCCFADEMQGKTALGLYPTRHGNGLPVPRFFSRGMAPAKARAFSPGGSI